MRLQDLLVASSFVEEIQLKERNKQINKQAFDNQKTVSMLSEFNVRKNIVILKLQCTSILLKIITKVRDGRFLTITCSNTVEGVLPDEGCFSKFIR